MSGFTWIPFYKELAAKILAYRDRQDELIAVLKDLKEDGVPVISLEDKATKNKVIPLSTIDPFTFFAAFNRKATDRNRQAVLAKIKERLQVQAAVPTDFDGIPVMHPMMSRFLPWQYEQQPDDTASLWAFAEAVVIRAPEDVPAELFNRCLAIRCVSVTNLTMGMFWMQPDTYLALDSRNRALLDERGVAHEVKDWASYRQFLTKAKPLVSENPYEFSRVAYAGMHEVNYWVFQCNPKVYDLAAALNAGVVTGWQVNQHKKDIHAGDKVIVWVTGDDGGCYALGTVKSEVKSFTEDIREAPFYRQPPKKGTHYGVDLRIEMPLWEHPIKRSDIMGHPGLRDFPAGRQGTNVSVTKGHYDGILALAKGRNAMCIWKVSHGKTDFTTAQRQTYLQEHTIHVRKSTKKGQGSQFSRHMKEGDLFYLCHGNDDGIRVFGRITGPATLSPLGDGWLKRPYEVLFPGTNTSTKYAGVKKGWAPNYRSTCVVVPDDELALFEAEILTPFFGKHLADIDGTNPGPRPAILPSCNLILYGPPGTGKTWTLRNDYMERFTERAAAMNKEDFATNLVADMTWWQVIAMVMLDLKTSKVSGMMEHPLMQVRIRQASNRNPRAAIWAHLQMHTKKDCEEVRYDKRFEPLLFSKDEKSVWSIDDKLAADVVPELIDGLRRYRDFKPGQGTEIRRYDFTTFHQSYSYEDFIEGIKPIMAEEVGETVAYEIKPGIFKTMAQRALADPDHDYALLIDEISRGNVANIFGELITLIEDDKRKGAANELTARLPYSRDEFVVPKNLYIIGAMNTADRSVEALDTALRRRFTFVAIPPRPDLIEQPASLHVDLLKLLTIINARIERLLDKDHCIGHSYFMNIAAAADPLAELRRVFATKILPLMEEYFYGDPAKIGMVLGETFVSRKADTTDWAKGDWGLDEYEERHVYSIRDVITATEEDFRAVYE